MDDKIKISISMSLDEANWLLQLLFMEEDFEWTPFFTRIRNVVERATDKHIEKINRERLTWDEQVECLELDISEVERLSYRSTKGLCKHDDSYRIALYWSKFNENKEFLSAAQRGSKKAHVEINPFAGEYYEYID